MEILKSQQNCRGIELGGEFIEPANLLDVKEEFPSRTVVDHEKEFLVSLESIPHLDDEGVIGLLEDLPLSPNVFDQVSMSKVALFDHLHCK